MLEPGKTPGRLYLEAILSGRATPPPFAALLNMRLTQVGDGTVSFEMPVTESLYNPNDVVHGGALTSLLDSAMGLAVVSTLGEGETFTTAELKVNFLRPVTTESGTLQAIGRVIHRGRQIVVAEADCVDANRVLVARATSTNLVLVARAEPVIPPPLAVAPPMPQPIPPPSPQPMVVAPIAPPMVAPSIPHLIPQLIPPPIPPLPPPPIAQPFSAPPSSLERQPAAVGPGPASIIAPAPLAQTKQHIRLFAGDMAYLRRGQGPPVVLLHGIPTSSYLWRDVIDPLAERFDVIAPDLVGYGDSEKRLDADLSVASQARYVVAFMEALQVYKAAIVGHDLGGGIAQLIATDEPGRVARLILIDSIAENNWPVPDIARLRDPAWDQIMAGLDLHKGFKKGLEAGLAVPGRMSEDLLEEWVRPFADQEGRRGYLRAARALNNRDLVSRAKHIEEISAPTLILWGAQDRFLDKTWGEHLQRKIRGAVLEVIDPGGHFLPLDRPDAVVEQLLRFLA